MTDEVAHDGGEQPAGDYLIGYAIEEARFQAGRVAPHAHEGRACRHEVTREPPTFMRHEEVNSRRFTEPVDVEFCGVKVERGQD